MLWVFLIYIQSLTLKKVFRLFYFIKKNKIKTYNDLTRDQRLIICKLFFKENKSMNYILKLLNKSKSKISR